jgi:ubiquinone/menaquinone biosynthesis C-methylase UbiE
MIAQLHLLPEEVLVKTGPVDHADWNYRPLLGAVQRARFRLLLRLIGDARFGRLLEIGYGSGVFLPELARRSRELYGIDIHEKADRVAESLRKLDVGASLCTTSAESMPFDAGFFDAVVAVSSFEFIADFDRACEEIGRVLVPGGAFFVVTPGDSFILDAGLKVLTGADAKRDYGGRRKEVMPALERHFRIADSREFPNRIFPIYRGFKLVPRTLSQVEMLAKKP